jgi:hypothetical protein
VQEWDRVAYIGPDAHVPADGSMTSPKSGFHAHVESYKDDHYEEAGGSFDDADAAITWARERAPIVLVRLGGTHDTFFSAGLELAEDEDGTPFPLRHASEPPNGWWQPTAYPPRVDPG